MESRRTCFAGEDDGLASIADMEAGFSGHHQHSVISRPMYYSAFPRRGSFRNPPSPAFSPRSMRYFSAGRYEELLPRQPHFLEACALCRKTLGGNRDIFMYRGDIPFCSEECRQERIEMDEAEEKKWSLSASVKALRKNQKKKSNSTSPNKAQDYPFRTGTVAAA